MTCIFTDLILILNFETLLNYLARFSYILLKERVSFISIYTCTYILKVYFDGEIIIEVHTKAIQRYESATVENVSSIILLQCTDVRKVD